MGISIQIAVEHHNMDAPIFLSPEAAEQIVRALRRRERRTMHYAVQLRQLHRLQGVAFKKYGRSPASSPARKALFSSQ